MIEIGTTSITFDRLILPDGLGRFEKFSNNNYFYLTFDNNFQIIIILQLLLKVISVNSDLFVKFEYIQYYVFNCGYNYKD